VAKREEFVLAVFGLLLLPYGLKAQARGVAMTVDDLPFASGTPKKLRPADAKQAQEVNEKILRAFAHRHIPATGFVIEQRAEELGLPSSTKILKQWVRPGFDLGNHLYSHADVNSLSVEQVEQEIIRGEASIAPLLAGISRKPHFLRFPYNHTGDTKEKHAAIARLMTARGYRLAPCTIDGSDYEFNTTYVLALARHDEQTAARVRAGYISYTAMEIDWYTALDKQVFGYEPPHVMLLHDNALNADTLEALLGLFEQRGYRFLTLAEALRDPAYTVPETYITKYGPMWGYRWANELGVKVNGHDEPNPPSWIDQYLKDHQ
jgi:peptidoglycan/xylan/chitin deacetylase (PgdA/CDA1 family)